jgi:drug/metabolite transporter (DMT)-like permease
VLGEPLGWHHLAGGALILSGVGLVMAVQTARRVPNQTAAD